MSDYLGVTPSQVPVGTIATKGTLSGNSLAIGSNVVVNTSTISIGSATINSTAFSGNANTATYANGSFTNTFTIGTAAYFVVNGNVGIGAASPSQKLSVVSAAAGDAISWTNGGANGKSGYLYSDQNISAIFNVAGANAGRIGMWMYPGNGLVFDVGAQERMRIDTAGNIGVGTTSTATGKINVSGAGSAAAVYLGGLSSSNIVSDIYIDRSSSTTSITAAPNIRFSDGTNNRVIQSGNGNLQFFRYSGSWIEDARIDSNGNVGIGTTSSASRLTVNGSFRQLAPTVPFEWTANAGAYDFLKLNSVGYVDNLLSISSYGTVGVCTTASIRNNTCLQLRDGIGFPATQVASSDANTLDDYEEGTWTPSMVPSTGAFGSITYDWQSGIYTKVGRLVTVYGSVGVASLTSGTSGGNLTISGLPFTKANLSNNSDNVGFWINSSYGWNVNPTGIWFPISVNYFYPANNSGSSINNNYLTPANLAAGSRIFFSGFYYTST